MNTDQFGYYRSAGIHRYSKIEAMHTGKTTFHFNDEVFSMIDTRVEPPESLWQLYKERARQIRNKYDYVVLMYSGGSDSNNILESFLQSDCKIDEICTTWDYPTTGEAYSHHNGEATAVVRPRIHDLKVHNIDFKFRDVDITPLAIKSFERLGMNFEYYVNHYLSVNNIAKQFLREHIKEWADMISKGKKLALVWGVDKPYMRFHDGKHWMYFKDGIDSCVGPYSINKPGWFDELFYWTPSMPSIVIKQAHVVAKFCKTNISQANYSDRDFCCGYSPKLQKFLTYNALKTIIYPNTWAPQTYCNGKSASFIYSQRDEFFLNGNVNVHRFNEIVNTYFSRLNDGTPQNQRSYVLPMYSKEYEIC